MSSYVARQINLLAVRLIIMAGIKGRDLDRNEARREAARQIAAQTRERRKHRATLPPPTGRPTLHNVRAHVVASIERLAHRLRHPISPARSAPPAAVRKASPKPGAYALLRPTRPRVNKPIVTVPPVSVEPSPPPTVGVYAGIGSSAELIPDNEYHTSLRYGDTATDNWRKSIEAAEQATARRHNGSTWIG
jgi:hypothetical protein